MNITTGEISLQCSEQMFDKAMKQCRKMLKSYARIPKTPSFVSQPANAKSEVKLTQDKSSEKNASKVQTNSNTKPKKAGKSYTPKLDTSLNLLGLPAFYDQYKPSNHSEKILIFTMFLKDELSISPCELNQIYSCYLRVKDKTKVPKAFQQAFRDAASSDYGFIEFSLATGIIPTIHGSNHFEHDLKRTDKNE